MAASNNADLYEAVFESRALRYERRPFAFIGRDRPPPYYSNLTVLLPNCASQVISELRDAAHRFNGAVGFKDSFCEFELGGNGFELLFEASWIWRAAEPIASPKGWTKIDKPAELEKWELAWKRSGSPTRTRMFPESMLQSPNVVFLGKMEGGEFVSGCIANVSGDCVGLSNLFSTFPEGAAFEEATAAVAALDPRLPIVGYAAGLRLEAARQAGYERTGGLRILEARNARF